MFFDKVLEEPDQKSVESAKYDFKFFTCTFFMNPDPDFSDLDPEFLSIRIQTK